MSASFQAVDPTRGHHLVSTQSQNREAPRYLFTAGQFLEPNRLFQLEHLRESGGGEEVQSHCLRRSVGGFIQRGHLTPMEVWAEPLPPVLIGEGAERDTVRIEGPTSPESLGLGTKRPGGLAGVGAALVHYKYYPGDEIASVLRANTGKGIVEITSLLGVPWYDDELETKPGLPQLLNRDFFPTRPPIELRKLRERIEEKSLESPIHEKVAREMLNSCDQFLRWAETFLAVEHELLRTRRSHQHTYVYSPIARELLKQLEMQPQDSILERMSSGIDMEQLREIIQGVSGGMNVDAISQIAAAVAQQFIAAQQKAAPVEAPAEVKNKGGRPRKPVEGETGEPSADAA